MVANSKWFKIGTLMLILRILTSVVLLTWAFGPSQVWGATATNIDVVPQTLTVTESGNSNELMIRAGETVEFCIEGCFVTFANDDKQALTGSEHLDVSGGTGSIK
jgi:hypothetical protein